MTNSPYTQCPILFEDADLLVINKPEGVLSHPNPGTQSASAFEGPYDLGARKFQTPGGSLWLIHRLDQDTSGALLAAKNKKSVSACRMAFEKREVKKLYLALVSRRPMPPHGIWRDTLMEQRSASGVRSAINYAGRPNAFLNYKMKEHFPKYNLSLLEIELLTGKTHQIRVQSAYRGHPVAGDRIYGNFTLNKELKAALDLRRMFLHAWKLTFPHPASGKPLTVEAPLPEDLEDCLVRISPKKR
ncbi:MAG: RluA family pseudouridine synthase [Candidatus Omnitrophica bacterium]|nr:RluA family pseudouridine synthase [Candidatus Omnitrophota bacterium]